MVRAVFEKHDSDYSGDMNASELVNALNELVGHKKAVTPEMARRALGVFVRHDVHS